MAETENPWNWTAVIVNYRPEAAREGYWLDQKDMQLKGVRGWLLLLCLLLTVFDPFVVLVTLFVVSDGVIASRETHPEFFRLVLISGVLRIGLAVFSMYAGLSLWRIAPNAVTIARRYLVSIALLSVFLLFLPWLMGGTEPSGRLGEENVLNTLLTVFYVAVWCAYLSRSKRVKATYSSKNEIDAGR